MMERIKVLVIEDNAFMADIFTDMLQDYHNLMDIIGVAFTGVEGINMIKSKQPDLVFLDIELPDMTGFELLNKLEAITFRTIFTTSHTHYAIKAFRFNALDYLVKPIDEDELAEAINKFRSDITSEANRQHVQQALSNLKTKNVEDQILFLQTQTGELRLPLKKIIKIEGNRNYSLIYLDGMSKELSSKTLGYFEEVLQEKGFFRCHRSFLVNKVHIRKMNGNHFILSDQSSIPISRRKKLDAKNWIHSQID